MVAWILTQSVSQIFNGNHIKDLWTFYFPQKSAVSNISFQEASEYQISLVFTLRSLNSILGKWTHFETWDSITDFIFYLAKSWFLIWIQLVSPPQPPSFPFSCWPFILIKRQFVSIPAISPTYFQTNWSPPRQFKTEGNYSYIDSHQISQMIYVFLCLPALITFPESSNRF